MRRFLVFLLWIVFGQAVTIDASFAQAVIVRSGEHRDYSRLVLKFAHLKGWKLWRHGTKYELTTSSGNQPIDYSQVFRFIPKTRLQAIMGDPGNGGVIRMIVSQDHHVTATEMLPGKLVVDIRRGRPDSPDGLVARGGMPDPTPKAPVRLSSTSSRESYITAKQSVRGGKTVNRTEKFPPGPKRQVVVVPSPMPDFRVLRAQEQLIGSLDNALAEGVISRAIRTPPQRVLVPSLDFENGASDVKNNAHDPAQPDGGIVASGAISDHLNIKTSTVFDRARNRKLQIDQERSTGGSLCLDDSHFDMSGWKDSAPVHRQISRLRMSLSDEIDQVDPAVLQKLVRLYVVLGFGTEARALMHAFDIKMPDRSLLTDLSGLLESGKIENSRVLTSQTGCKGAVQLWTFLASGRVPLGQTPDREMISGYFSNLSADLRQRIGPVFGEILLLSGFEEDAHAVARIIARSAGKDHDAFSLFQARLDLKDNHRTQARHILNDLIKKSSQTAPEALIVLARDYLQHGDTVPDRIFLEIGAHAFTLRRSKMGGDLTSLEIKILASRGDQNTAFGLLSHEGLVKTLDAPETRHLSNDIFMSFSNREVGNATFVPTYYRYRHLLGRGAASDAVRQHIADLLLQANLPEAALRVLTPMADRLTDNIRLLYARAFLLSERFPEVASILANVDNEAARQVRISALSKTKAFDQAVTVAKTANASVLKEDVFWWAGKQNLENQSKVPSRKLFAPFLRSTSGARAASGASPHDQSGASPPVSLAEAKNLLKQSRTARAEIDVLKSEHPFP